MLITPNYDENNIWSVCIEVKLFKSPIAVYSETEIHKHYPGVIVLLCMHFSQMKKKSLAISFVMKILFMTRKNITKINYQS